MRSDRSSTVADEEQPWPDGHCGQTFGLLLLPQQADYPLSASPCPKGWSRLPPTAILASNGGRNGIVADFEQSQEMDVAPEAVWALVSDPGRLADWVPTTTASHPAGHDAVQLQGESHGHDYDLRGGFVASDDARRLVWDSPRQSGYRGSLTVAEHDVGSRVTVQVTIPDIPGSAHEEITRGLRETLDRIGRLARA